MDKNLFCSLAFLFSFAFLNSYSQEKDRPYFFSGIGFWNLENLYDTIDDPLTSDEEFLPGGSNQWNAEKYAVKLKNLSEVIARMGAEISSEGLMALGVAEIENQSVLQDLVNTEKLKPFNYQIVHYNSPDKRGIDVAFLYQPRFFKVTSSRSFALKMDSDTGLYTRDQLLVSGIFDGKPLHIIVAHWPSRRGGAEASSPKRIAAATLARSIVDSLIAADADARIIYMGDMNDDPVNTSVKEYLCTGGNDAKLKNGKLFNAMEDLFGKGIGTLAWNDKWNLFDQVLLSQPLVKKDFSTFQFYSAGVFDKPFVKEGEGPFKGHPFRTYSGRKYTGGYSDHFAVYVTLAKEKK